MMAPILLMAALQLSPPAACSNTSDERAVADVRTVANGIIDADNKRDITRVLTYYHADAVLLPPGEPPVVGHDHIRPRYAALFEGFNPAIVSRLDEACVSGPLAYVRGHNGGRMNPRSGGQPRELNDAFLMILRKDAAGEWHISHLMWHAATR